MLSFWCSRNTSVVVFDSAFVLFKKWNFEKQKCTTYLHIDCDFCDFSYKKPDPDAGAVERDGHRIPTRTLPFPYECIIPGDNNGTNETNSFKCTENNIRRAERVSIGLHWCHRRVALLSDTRSGVLMCAWWQNCIFSHLYMWTCVIVTCCIKYLKRTLGFVCGSSNL